MSASTVTTRAASPARGSRTSRRHELDWLRMAAVFGLIPFHTAVIFTTGSYDYIKNAQTTTSMDVLTSFVSIWGIPLLFLVAGASARFALASRRTAQYLDERVMRLLIPFIFGLLLIVPLQIYIGRIAAGTAQSPFAFYVSFLQVVLGVLTGNLKAGPEWIGHLWFIPLLMVFAVLALPFARLLRTRGVAHAVDALASRGYGYGVLALFGLPLAAVQLLATEGIGLFPTIDTRFTGNAIGVLAYLIFFLYGYLIYQDGRFVSSVRRDGWLALTLGVVTWLAIVVVIPQWLSLDTLPHAATLLLAVVRGYCSWWWVMGILGLAIRYLTFTTPVVEYLVRASYPVYIIHMPILTFIGMWIVRLDMNIWLKFGIITVLTFAASIAIYDLLIRRVPVLRLLFGLQSPRREAKRHAQPPAPAPMTPTPATS